MPQVTFFPIRKQNGTLPVLIALDQNNNEIVVGKKPAPIALLAKDLDENQAVGATLFTISHLLHWMAQRGDPSWTRLASSRTLLDVAVKQIAGIG